jgi:SRSO17 transposase
LALARIEDVQAQGCRFTVVLADSLDGESWDFRTALAPHGLPDGLAIRGNHAVWTAPGEHKRSTTWRP